MRWIGKFWWLETFFLSIHHNRFFYSFLFGRKLQLEKHFSFHPSLDGHKKRSHGGKKVISIILRWNIDFVSGINKKKFVFRRLKIEMKTFFVSKNLIIFFNIPNKLANSFLFTKRFQGETWIRTRKLQFNSNSSRLSALHSRSVFTVAYTAIS